MTFPPITNIEPPYEGKPQVTRCQKAEWLAEILDMTRQQVYNAVGDGQIPASCIVRVGRRLRFKEAETLAWIKNGGMA